MAKTDIEAQQRGRYGDDVIDDGLDACDDHNTRVDDEDEDEDEPLPRWLADTIGKSATTPRRLQMVYTNESLSQTLDKLEKSLNGADWREAVGDLDEDLDDVRERVARARAQGTSLAKAVDADIQRLHQRINALAQDSTSKDYVRRQLARLWAELQEARNDWKDQEVDDARDTDTQALIKSVASFLDDNATPAQAERTAKWVYKSFGRRGGQAVPFDREACARLRLAKSLTPTEEQNWKTYGRLPDHIDLAHPRPRATAQHERDASLLTQHALASMGLSPLVFPSLARR